MQFIKNKWVLDDDELSKLQNMLADVQFSLLEIAEEFGVSVDTIVRLRKEYKFEYKRKEVYCERIELTDIQKEVLYGCLLGDGCLNIHKDGKNAIFSYTSKSKEMVEYVMKYFSDIPNSGIRYTEYYDKRTNKLYSRYTFKTHVNPTFTEIYHKWYVNKIKIIPADLVLTPTICLLWYLGDGSLVIPTRGHKMHINFATHCFEKKEIEDVLISQLSKYNSKITKSGVSKNDKQQYSIEIPGRNVDSFLHYIGDCPVRYYSYKWNVIEYERVSPKSCKEYEETFISLYKNGLTCYKIAKMFGVSVNAVKRYIKKAGIYEPVNKINLVELEVFKYLDSGCSQKEIMENLNISRYLFYYYRKKWIENGKKI